MSRKKLPQDQKETPVRSSSKPSQAAAPSMLPPQQSHALDLQQKAGNQASAALLRPSQEHEFSEQEARRMVDQPSLSQTAPSSSTTPASIPPSLFEQPGEPLPGALRQRFEQRFGRDLSRVRLHRSAQAAQAAEALSARAFTHGQEIAFNTGEYAPHTSGGEQLLAHEVAHTLQPQPPGVALRQPKPADKPKAAPKTDLEKAEDLIKDGLTKLDAGKDTDLKGAPKKLRDGIKLLKKVAAKETGDRKAKMERIASALETAAVYAEAATAKSGGLDKVQKAFADKDQDVLGQPEIASGKFEKAADLHKGLPQDFTDIFPKLGMADPGINLMDVVGATEQRLRYMESMSKAGAAPKKYPPGADEVEAYFSKLGASKAKDEDIVKAYEDYAGAFFKHAPRDIVATDMSTKKVYSGKITYNLNLLTDCDGFVRLGVALFGKAGYKLDDVMVGVRDVSSGSGSSVVFSDAHAVALVSKGGDSHYISNQEIYGSESSAFNSVAWSNPDAALVIGHGKNLADAEKDAVSKLGKKGSK
jgi:hypothetical protein